MPEPVLDWIRQLGGSTSEESLRRVLKAAAGKKKRRKPKHLPTFFRPAEADLLLAAATTPRDRLIIQVGLFLGLRVSEITKMAIEELDLSQGLAFIREAKGGKDRYVPIPTRLLQPLKDWIGDRHSGLVFPSPRGGRLTSRAIQRLMKRLGKAAGIAGVDVARKVTPHKMRHTYATTLLKRKADIRQIQRLLGHSSVATTELYTHVIDDELKEVVDRL